MEYTIEGKIINASPLRSGLGNNGREWHERNFVVQVEGKYPKCVCLSLRGERAYKFSHQVGEQVRCKFGIDALNYYDKWFNRLECHSVERV